MIDSRPVARTAGVPVDVRHDSPRWDPASGGWLAAGLVATLAAVLSTWYLGWLLWPGRAGHPVLYAALVAAEVFNLTQAVGFWWTLAGRRRATRPGVDLAPFPMTATVDVLVPVYDEPVDVVAATVEAATRIRGAAVHVVLCDDGCRDEMRQLAADLQVAYLPRESSHGAKAGNINHALAETSGEYVVVFDSDHVAHPSFLERTLPHFADADVAFVQTPQYYANTRDNEMAGTAWEQQALFFGPIGRGKEGHGAMFCCGTNVVFRRTALDEIGGFPTDSITEDFALSIALHERGWRSVYVPEVLASGLGPEDAAAYVGQQDRWARGCLTGLGTALRAQLPWRVKAQYLLSAGFFLTGWTYLVYLLLPVLRLTTGAQPIASEGADQFLLHFATYFGLSLLTVAVAGAGSYTFRAYATTMATFWIHVRASLAVLFGRTGGFTVTPKGTAGSPQPSAMWPSLAAVVALVAVATIGLVREVSASSLNNVAFVALHVTILLRGAWPALVGAVLPATTDRDDEVVAATYAPVAASARPS